MPEGTISGTTPTTNTNNMSTNSSKNNSSTTLNEDQNINKFTFNNLPYATVTFLFGGIAGCAGMISLILLISLKLKIYFNPPFYFFKIAKTVVAPLDRVKILFQTGNPKFKKFIHAKYGMLKAMKSITTEYGVSGLFRGHSMQLARIYPYAAIKFMSYEQIKRVGVISVFMTFPFDMIRVRMAYETPTINSNHERVRETILKIYKEKANKIPILNFYRGFLLSVVGMIPYGGVSFLTHNFCVNLMKKKYSKYTVLPLDQQTQFYNNTPSKSKKKLRAWAELTAGGISGVIAQTCSYPFELIRRQLQVSGTYSPEKILNPLTVVKSIYKEHGFRGFFTGLTIGYIKVVPMFAVSFYTYEKLKSLAGID
ncbi:hypothetical protein BB561_002887 [Smittium simulii]|uniref:Mitochondrial carrier protein n=1 Tax=Smittium simulii TaxID=133385 RepID=A0A2T9YNX8_9FUNG|nr:hypothetical protein BB561_002887 [Smittium simulii]